MRRRSFLAVPTALAATAVLAGALILAPAAAAAHHGSHKGASKGPNPKQEIPAMVQVHDSTATQAYDEFNDTIHQFISYDANLEHCHEVEGESGESREASEASLREAAAENVKLVEAVFVDFNQSLPRWAGYVEGYRSDVSKRKRAKLGQIAELLREAHDEHAEEFFHMKGIWVQMEGVHCAGAEEEKQATVNAGSGAWTKEAAALRLLEVLFGVRETIEYPLGPYV